MELIVTKLKHHYQGFKVVLREDDDSMRDIAIINGNDASHHGPVVLLNIDQHIVYGLSHPEVVSQIFTKGPQILITTKEMAHNLFEHGMKASVGKVQKGVNTFLTTLETFYDLKQTASILNLIIGKHNQLGCLIKLKGYRPILLSSYLFTAKESDKDALSNVDYLEIDNISNYVSSKFVWIY